MNNTVKTYASIAAKSLSKGLLIAGVGFFLSMMCMAFALYFLFNNESSVGVASRAGSAGAIAFIRDAFIKEPTTVLLLLLSIVFIYLYAALGFKTSLQNSAYLIWNNQLGDYFTPRIASYIRTLQVHQPEWFTKAAKATIIKTKLIEASQNDKEINPVQRKVLRYGLKQAGLDNINFQDPQLDLAAVIANRIRIKISEISKPSFVPFAILAGVQIVLLIVALVYDNK